MAEPSALPLFSPSIDPGPSFSELLRQVSPHQLATAGYSIASRRIDKVFAADEFSGVAIAGAAGPAVEMVKLFQTQLEHYEKVQGDVLSLEGKANQLSQLVRSNLPAAMQ